MTLRQCQCGTKRDPAIIPWAVEPGSYHYCKLVCALCGRQVRGFGRTDDIAEKDARGMWNGAWKTE